MSDTRRWLALLALGSAAFTLLGSLVPFEFRAKPLEQARHEFARSMTGRVWPQSKSDAVANVMLGVPLGFALLGLACGGRAAPRPRAALYGLALLPACAAFAAAVEFAQVFAPDRYTAGSDVLAQTLGAALGVGLWLACGPWLTEQARQAATGTAPAARFLAGYVAFLAFVQALPLDVSASPADAYRKFRDGGVKPVPFHEFGELSGDAVLGRMATLLKLASLYLPVGLLAARVPGRFWRLENYRRVFAAGFGLALALELGQVLVRSRTTSATDVVVGAAAAFLGWLIGRCRVPGPSHAVAMAAGVFCVIVWIGWQPFEPGPRVPFDWIPGAPLEGGNPLIALGEMLTKLVLFGLLGAAIVSPELPSRSLGCLPVAAAAGLLASALVELGQTRFAGHTPGITDVLLGGCGAAFGAWVAGRVGATCERGHQ